MRKYIIDYIDYIIVLFDVVIIRKIEVQGIINESSANEVGFLVV